MSTNSSRPLHIDNIEWMKKYISEVKAEYRSIAVVPTMGALHEGHLDLVRKAADRGDIVVVTIFVNPAQFGENEDYNEYTRDIEGDLDKLAPLGTDVVFTPSVEEIYPPGYRTYVEVTELQDNLCGKFRPGHFKGVVTIVLKLFNIIRPDFAVFGEKDYQQLRIVRQMTVDLNLDIEILSVPVKRERNGLAMSSRNAYLNREQRERALLINRALRHIKIEFDAGVKDVEKLVEIGINILLSNNIVKIDYLEIVDSCTLEKVDQASAGDLVALAVRLGNTRLIDNLRL